MIEDNFNDLKQVIEQCKARKSKKPGSIWMIKVLYKDWVIYFITVLKIDDDTYRFFEDPQHANDMRILRGLDEHEEIVVKYKTGNQIYRPMKLGDFLS
jgi:hypothetical protein